MNIILDSTLLQVLLALVVILAANGLLALLPLVGDKSSFFSRN